MDDTITSVDSIEETQELRQQLTTVSETGGFHYRKWISNEPDALIGVEIADRANGDVEIQVEKTDSNSILGMKWRPRSDTLTYDNNLPNREVTTKRELLQAISTVFDPRGLI
ncbi:uncharacterized protein LOC141898991 [Tubulanus polymorphus]|uniref:uncharacterized protein LOC141898991 n=1 Tax=Tubulanus polymorphus TaxID=672921 RepID=UPI003DA5604A